MEGDVKEGGNSGQLRINDKVGSEREASAMNGRCRLDSFGSLFFSFPTSIMKKTAAVALMQNSFEKQEICHRDGGS